MILFQEKDIDERSTDKGDESSNDSEGNVMIYNVRDRPPFYLSIFFGLQVYFII
jgi:hypothetical protein